MNFVARRVASSAFAAHEIFGTMPITHSKDHKSLRSGLKYIRQNKTGDLLALYYPLSFRQLDIPFFFNENKYTSMDRNVLRKLKGKENTKPHQLKKTKGKKK